MIYHGKWECNRKNDHADNCCDDDQWESGFYIVHKFVSPGATTIVLAGIPIGVAYAQEPPITHAINTALGSAPIPCAMERQIGTISAVVAVFDISLS